MIQLFVCLNFQISINVLKAAHAGCTSLFFVVITVTQTLL